jgi:hypothetical protein
MEKDFLDRCIEFVEEKETLYIKQIYDNYLFYQSKGNEKMANKCLEMLKKESERLSGDDPGYEMI